MNNTCDYITSRSDLNKHVDRRITKALKKQTNAAFIPLFDLNAYHRILELHGSEDCVILIVGDQHGRPILTDAGTECRLHNNIHYRVLTQDPSIQASRAGFQRVYQTIHAVLSLVPEHSYPLTAEYFGKLAAYVRSDH